MTMTSLVMIALVVTVTTVVTEEIVLTVLAVTAQIVMIARSEDKPRGRGRPTDVELETFRLDVGRAAWRSS